MRILSVAVITALAGLGLAGCADKTQSSPSRLFGLISGPLPQPQPFVVESRSATPSNTYPVIGTTPPPRDDKVLDMKQRKELEDSLLATPGRQQSADQAAAEDASKKKAAKKRKPDQSTTVPATN
jgi:hypothetical protein